MPTYEIEELKDHSLGYRRGSETENMTEILLGQDKRTVALNRYGRKLNNAKCNRVL